ncbi:unnamed protein product, partial [Coregonus sp. 'balchen']
MVDCENTAHTENKMKKLELLKIFFTERLAAAADEIFGAVKGTIVEYQTEIVRSKEENNHLRKLLDIAVQRVLLQTARSENSAQPNINNRIQRGLSEYKAPQPQGTYERESIGLHIH